VIDADGGLLGNRQQSPPELGGSVFAGEALLVIDDQALQVGLMKIAYHALTGEQEKKKATLESSLSL
jgi:hypothetical protein